MPEHGQPGKMNSYQQPRPDQGVGLLEPVPSLVLDGFEEPPSFDSAKWLDGQGSTLVDHPLMRGLLLELPPKGSQPSPEWMNRWFEAARAVLDLIYNRR
ncbi:MAG TPA: hypothetical protein VF062_08600 [Candidatus Limnocylindrales bacterium]